MTDNMQDKPRTKENNQEEAKRKGLSKERENWSRLIIGDGNYQPTQLQTQVLFEYIADEKGRTPSQILIDSGKCPDNWWVWPRRYVGFMDWWNSLIDNVMSNQRLHDMYRALYRRALTHDTGAAKLIAQRFDPKYTERSHQDIRGVFAGYEPTEAQDSRERQRKALAGPVPGARAVLGSNGGITGVGPVSTCFTPCIHPIAGRKQREPEPGTPACNDETLDFKPVTKVDPPGGGL